MTEDVAALSPDGGAHLGLSRWVSTPGASLYYLDTKTHRVAAGAPHGDALSGVFEEFEADCRRARRRPVYFGLPSPYPVLLDPRGRRGRWHAGDLPVFALERWKNPATIPSSIRAQVRRARNQGVTVRHLDTAPVAGDRIDSALRECLKNWLRSKPLPPMSFVTTPFLFDPWPEGGVFVAERDGTIEGFLVGSTNLLPGLFRVDAVARTEGAPNGCAELLVAEAFRHAASIGHSLATLGLAPLSKRSTTREASPHWMDRVAEFVREARVPGYSFGGLEAFKAKFEPDEWRPVYCVSGGGKLSVRDMTAIARVFAGGSLFGYTLRTLAWRLGRRVLTT